MQDLLDATRPTTRNAFATSTLPAIERVRIALNFYDYAGQDPINNYDLDGTMLWIPGIDQGGFAVPFVPTSEEELGVADGGAEADAMGASIELEDVLGDPKSLKGLSYRTVRRQITEAGRQAGWTPERTANDRGIRWGDPNAQGIQIRVMRPSPGARPGSWPSQYRVVVSNGQGPPIHVELRP